MIRHPFGWAYTSDVIPRRCQRVGEARPDEGLFIEPGDDEIPDSRFACSGMAKPEHGDPLTAIVSAA
jgi:hypothetical protein